MTAPSLSHWLKVDLTLKHKEDLSTKTISLTNRVEIGDTSSDHWPLLLSINGIGTSSDDVSVLANAGSIIINDELGSFGVERKFSDLLNRYVVIDQDIEILYATTETTSENPTSYATIFKGKAYDWNVTNDRERQLLTISFDSRVLSKRYLTKKITPEEFTSAPSRSIFKTLPVIIGEDVQVRPILIAADADESPEYAYATTLGEDFPCGGVTAYYTRDAKGEYVEVQSASAVATPVFSGDTAAAGNHVVSNGEAANIFKLSTDTSYNYIITQVDVRFDGAGPQTYDGTLGLKIYEGTTSVLAGTSYEMPSSVIIASGTRNTSDYDTSLDGGGDVYISFTLERPAVLKSDRTYFVGVAHDPDVGYALLSVRAANGGTTRSWNKLPGGEWKIGTASRQLDFLAYGVKFSDNPDSSASLVNSEGLGHSYFELTQRTAITGINNPDLTRLEFIIATDGLKDDSSGTVTGSADLLITKVHHAVSLLSQEWDGSAWSASAFWDFSAYSSLFDASRTISGYTTSEVSFSDWLRDICRNTACKVVLRKNGKLGLYTYGSNQTSAATFTQENSKVIRSTQLDASYVVNRITIAHAKQLLDFNAQNIPTEGVSTDYTEVLKWNKNTSFDVATLVGNSEELYGPRELANTLYDWLAERTASQNVPAVLAQYFLNKYSEPPIYAVIEVPFSYYEDLEPQLMVKIKHPSLPTYKGSSPNTTLPHFEGDLIEPSGGYVLTRAQTYHGQIEAMEINFNGDSVPSLELTCRLITNPNDPTYIPT